MSERLAEAFSRCYLLWVVSLAFFGCVAFPSPTYRSELNSILQIVNAGVSGIGGVTMAGQLDRAQEQKLQDFEESIRFLLETEPNDPRLYDALGAIAFRRAQWARADEYFQAAQSIDPLYVRARVNRATLLVQRGDLSLAERELFEVLEIAPEEYQAYRLLRVICESRSDRECARRYALRGRLLMTGKMSGDSPHE